MGLRFDPMGGGQFKQAIKTIMEAESQPVKQLETRKVREEARLKLFQDFKTKFMNVDKAINDISSFKKFRELKVDMGDGQSLASVTIDKDKANPGSISIQVDSLASRTSVISNGFEAADDTSLGIGFIVMNMDNGETAEIFVDEDHASLQGISNLINAQANSPIRAAVMKDATDPETPFKLILTAKKEGKENHIDFPEFYFLDGTKDFYVDNDRSAKNAQLLVDGMPIELDSNDISDFLPGVNLHLKQARPDQPFTMTITEDHQKVSGKVKSMVDAMNSVLQFIIQQNTVDEKSDTRSTFAGDTGLQMVEYRLRNLFHEGFPIFSPDGENYRLVFLNEIGVEFDRTGLIGFKEEKFTKALEKDFDGLGEAITGEMGFAFQLKEIISNYTRPGEGLLSQREMGLRNRVKEIDRQIENKQRILERKHQALTDQFSRLQSTLSNMQRQQSYLQSTLGGGGGNMISQLLG